MTETASAGAMPVAGGATPPQTPASPVPATPPIPAPSATDDDALGDAGKRALAAERSRATTAERERDDYRKRLEALESASQSDHEKAVSQAKKDGAAEVSERLHAQLRRSEVRAALASAGVNASLLDLASRADQFATLKVSDEGQVEGLDAAIEAFRRATPDAFAKATPPRTDAGLGPRGTPPSGGTDLNTYIRRQAGRA